MLDLLKKWPMGEPVPAISLMQPWASAVLFFGKDVENRSKWPFKYRGPVIIHASKSGPYKEDLQRFVELAREDGATDEDLADISADSYPGGLFPQGCILGIANLTDVFQKGDSIPKDNPLNESPWKFKDAGYWLYLENATVVHPVAFKGFVGLFKVPYDVASRLRPVQPGEQIDFDG
jgi:hypothetical protein